MTYNFHEEPEIMIQDRLLILAIGTNHQSWNNIRRAKRMVREAFPESLVKYSSIAVTTPIGIGGKNFRNCLTAFISDLDIEEVIRRTKQIEVQCGNTQEKRTRGIVEMDIDILFHHGRYYHEQDWNRSYIQQLLQELLPADFISPPQNS